MPKLMGLARLLIADPAHTQKTQAGIQAGKLALVLRMTCTVKLFTI